MTQLCLLSIRRPVLRATPVRPGFFAHSLPGGTMKLLIACFFTALSLAGCSEAAKPVALSILGYNYTGRYISTFSVNQQGGGNLYEGSAGSRVVCCLSFKPTSKLPFTVEVEWELNDRRDFVKNEWIPAPEEHHRATVTVNGPLPRESSNFEVHFMPDGSVQAYVTNSPSSPFLLPNGKPNPDIRFAPPGDEILPRH